jgi:hypothetical protein
MSTAADEGATPVDGSGAGLIAFLNWTLNKKELVEATASALRTGCLKVLQVDGDWESIDLMSANLDDIVRRFRNAHRLDMKDRTLDQYEQRFRQSVDMYLKRLNGEPWQPTRTPRKPPSGQSSPTTVSNGIRGDQEQSRQERPTTGPGMITYPFPIRPGMQGKITLPEDLSIHEAKRIAAFISTLTMEEIEAPHQPLALMAGEHTQDR